MRCWGYNVWGQLGDGTQTDRWSPPTTDVLSDAQAVSAGLLYTCALTKAGGVRCWGDNDLGELGDDSGPYRISPPTANSLTGVRSIALDGCTCAVMQTRGLRCWGFNGHGQLGLGDLTVSALPAPVVGTCQ